MTDFPLPYDNADLAGQVALVTGASSGLGRRFALTLAAAGASVAACARRVEKLDDLVAEITASGGNAVSVPLDVSDATAIAGAVDAAEAAFGTVTILVNNAGMPDAQRAHKMSLELIDAVIDTNIRAVYVLSCEVARRLIAAEKPGRIVNISSTGSFRYGGNGRGALLRVEGGREPHHRGPLGGVVPLRINVNAIAPGAFRSEMMDGMISRVGDFTQMTPRKRLGEPAQLDSTLLYLCAPASECVTGTIVRVDDGQDAK